MILWPNIPDLIIKSDIVHEHELILQLMGLQYWLELAVVCLRLETRKRKPFGPRLNVMPCQKTIANTHKYLNLSIGHLKRFYLQFSAEEAVEYQLESLKYNDLPRPDYGIEVMYRVTIQAWKLFVHRAWCRWNSTLMRLTSRVFLLVCRLWPFREVNLLWTTVWSRTGNLKTCSFWLIYTGSHSVLPTDCHQILFQFERFRRLFHHSTYRVLLGHRERRILSSLWVEEVLQGETDES